LSAVFGVEEALQLRAGAPTLEEHLKDLHLGSGTRQYYDGVWSKLTARLDDGVALRVAAALVLSPTRVTAAMAAASAGTPETTPGRWEDALRSLAPLVVEENDGFRVFHNDVRVYLTGMLHRHDALYRSCAGKIADYLIDGEDAEARHSAAQSLLLPTSEPIPSNAT